MQNYSLGLSARAQGQKAERKTLSSEAVNNLGVAGEKIQVRFEEFPELKNLYYDQYVQLLDTLIRNKS